MKKRIAACAVTDVALSVISVEEKFGGWYSFLRKAKTPEHLLHGYNRLFEAVELLKPLQIISFSQAAYREYERLKSLKLGIKKMDLYIAAITLEKAAILVTRNVRDFRRVPSLPVEDWSASL